MDKKSFLLKEIIARTKERTEIEGFISTPSPIKEIHQVNHSIIAQKADFGEKSVAYFGEIDFKIIYVDNDSSLRQVEQSLPYRGISVLDKGDSLEQPIIKVHTSIDDIFAVKKETNSIKILGLLSIEITFLREIEVSIEELQGLLLKQDYSEQRQNLYLNLDKSEVLSKYEIESKAKKLSSEIITEVQEGTEQELNITIK